MGGVKGSLHVRKVRARDVMATNRQLAVVAVLAMTAVFAGCSSRPSSHPTASAGPASPSSAATKSTTTTSAPSIPIHSVDWGDVTVPGAVCDARQAIKLNAGKATINTPPGVVAGTPSVIIEESGVTYGNLSGTGQDDAAVNVWCTNTGGTADGQIADSWVIFTAHVGSLRVIGTLVPQQPSNATLPHVAY